MTTQTEQPISLRGRFQYHDVIGLLSAGQAGFSGPVSLDFGPDGRIYVVDFGNDRIQVFAPLAGVEP